MVTGTQTQTAWTLWIRDLVEMLETHLAEVKHQGELKLWHAEPQARGRLLHATIHWKSRHHPHRPARVPLTGPSGLSPTGTPGLHPPTGPPAHHLPPAKTELQHHQMPAPNMPRRGRQTGLDAKGVTPELLRLKFYCSWTRNFFFFFFL
jgi:hypothetical protein